MTSDQTKIQGTTSNAGQLTIPFTNRSIPGKIHVTLSLNTDSRHGCGFDLIFPSLPVSAYPSQLHGFPTMKASIEYAGPSAPSSSYAQFFGWIQFVKAVPIKKDESTETGEWEMDIFPFAKDLKMPFCFWGHNPTAFDAPCRLLKDDGLPEELVWRAHTFLCVLEDAGMSKSVQVLEGAAFGWGFDVETSEAANGKGVERKIIVKGIDILDWEKEWVGRLGLLRKEYPEWTFGDVPGNKVIERS